MRIAKGCLLEEESRESENVIRWLEVDSGSCLAGQRQATAG